MKSTGNAVDDLRKKNAALRKALTDGTWQREAKALSKARQELKLYGQEQERLQRQAQRQMFSQKYGRFGGAVAYGASRLKGAGGGVLNAASAGLGGLAGTAGMFGAALGAGALISRGFSGTSAAARLDMEIEKLSRTFAEKLMPVMNSLTNNISRINQATDRTRAGKGTFGDRAVSSLADPMNLIGAYGAYRGVRAIGGGSTATGAGRMFAGARAVGGGPLLAATVGIDMMRRGFAIGGMTDRQNELSSVTVRRDGSKRFTNQMTGEEWAKAKDITDEYGKLKDPGERAAFLKRQKEFEQRRLKRFERETKWTWAPTNLTDVGNNVRGFFGAWGGDTEEVKDTRRTRMRAVDRLAAGETPNGIGSNMMQVLGAGERRGMTDLHQELAEQIAQKMGGATDGQGSTLDDVIGVLNLIKEKIDNMDPRNW